jgi:hypothetical protein
METFEEYLVEARNEFCAKINEQDWNTELRMTAESFLIAYDQVVDKYKDINRRDVTKVGIMFFQNALVQLYETEKEETEKFRLFRDSYKSTIEELKSQL